jgi:Ribbon-helix-helix protein, copG family
MRTTINIDDDLMNAIRSLAAERRQSLGKVISDLIRRGLRPEPFETYSNDFPVFMVREGTPMITPEMVQSAMDES